MQGTDGDRLHRVMARIESETLTDREGVGVFIAETLGQAQRAEELLTSRGVDYVVRVEPFAYTLFGSARYGAMFYVSAGQADYCRSALAAAGMESGVVDAECD